MEVLVLLLQLLPLPGALGPQLAGPRALDPDYLLRWRVLNNISILDIHCDFRYICHTS